MSPVRSRPRLAGLLTVAAIGAASLGLGACGSTSKPSVSALDAKLHKEQALNQFSSSQIDCLAGVFRKYGDANSLKAYVNGKISANELKGSTSNSFKSAEKACVQ